jgi:hypothetical protein
MVSLGDELFAMLDQKYHDHQGFQALKSKLTAAQFLSNQMVKQLREATTKQMRIAAEQMLAEESTEGNEIVSVAPARNFYDASRKIFEKPVHIGQIQDQEREFLIKYYNGKLKFYAECINEAGQALAFAEPSFKGTHNYVLVLPLLHTSEEKSINQNLLPDGLTTPDQLRLLADSCLLHYDKPYHAMKLAELSLERQGKIFSAIDYYQEAAEKCSTERIHTAVDCLRKAYKIAKQDNDDNLAVSLLFKIVQRWIDTKNYSLAAMQAKTITEDYPEHTKAGQALWIYYYGLSQSGNTKEILANIDNALKDERCKAYEINLLYIKWLALLNTRDEARILAVEHQLLSQCGTNPIIAPIMLSRATNLLAQQDYLGARNMLRDLVDKFPTTSAAVQAKNMLDKLGKFSGM